MEHGTQIRIHVNGEARAVLRGTSVAVLVEQLGLRPEQVAVEVEERIVRRDVRTTTILKDGDRVEVVTLVGGG